VFLNSLIAPERVLFRAAAVNSTVLRFRFSAELNYDMAEIF
jgi:hypothetical protein